MPLPLDFTGSDNLVGAAAQVSVSLTAAETRTLLQEVPRTVRTHITAVLLAALARAVWSWTGASKVVFDVEGHGREDVFPDLDLSRTVGWFTAIHPLEITVEAAADSAAALLREVKQRVDRISRRGIGYGLLRWLGDWETAQRLSSRGAAAISFNYLGQISHRAAGSGEVRLAAERTGALRSAKGRRAYLIEVDALVHEGTLTATFTYATTVHRHATIERLATDFAEALRMLIHSAADPNMSFAAPRNLARGRVTRRDVDKIAARLGRKRAETSP